MKIIFIFYHLNMLNKYQIIIINKININLFTFVETSRIYIFYNIVIEKIVIFINCLNYAIFIHLIKKFITEEQSIIFFTHRLFLYAIFKFMIFFKTLLIFQAQFIIFFFINLFIEFNACSYLNHRISLYIILLIRII